MTKPALQDGATEVRQPGDREIGVEHRPSWLLMPRSERSVAKDAASLLAHLKDLFLGHYEGQTEAHWNTLVTGALKSGSQQGHGDFLAGHLLGAVRNKRPLDGTVMMAFSYNFSSALGYAIEAASVAEGPDPTSAWSLLADGRYFAGMCTVQADFKHPNATTAENLANARAQRKDRVWKADVFAWCDSNHHRFPRIKQKVNRTKLAEAVLRAKLFPGKFPAVYGWVCEWAGRHESSQ